MNLKCDAVFEGGGVKGIGFVGAIKAIEDAGYEFENLAGTSAGAIVASLLAVGYTADELKDILNSLDYSNFMDEDFLDTLGIFGKSLSAIMDYGIYKGDFLITWLGELLEKKNKTKFKDIITEYTEDKYKYKLQVIVSDITTKSLLVLPGDLKKFNIDPDEFKIVDAVRMSMSIPFFFNPVIMEDLSGVKHYLVDGGVLSNYPIWLLDDNSENPKWPTFGFKLVQKLQRKMPVETDNFVNSIIDFVKALATTMTDAHDKYYISKSKGDFERTISIPTEINLNGENKLIRTTDFHITNEESNLLYENGLKSANDFLKNWNFENWIEKYRKNAE